MRGPDSGSAFRGGSEPPPESKCPSKIGVSTPQIMPFGSSSSSSKPSRTHRRQRRRSSVGNIVAALEAEIRNRREASLGRCESEERGSSYIYGIRGSDLQDSHSISVPPSRSSSSDGSKSPHSSCSRRATGENSRPWMSKGSIYSTLAQFKSDNDSHEAFLSVDSCLPKTTYPSNQQSTNTNGRYYESETLVWQDNAGSGYVSEATSTKSDAPSRESKLSSPTKEINSSPIVAPMTSSDVSDKAGFSLFSQNMNSYWSKSKIKSFSNVTFSSEKKDENNERLSNLPREIITTPEGLPRLTPIEINRANSEAVESRFQESEISVEKTITVSKEKDMNQPLENMKKTVDYNSNSLHEEETVAIRDCVNYVATFKDEWTEDQNKSKPIFIAETKKHQSLEDLFDELARSNSTQIQQESTQSSFLTEDTFFNDLVKTEEGTITGLEDDSSDQSSSKGDLKSTMSPTNQNPDNNNSYYESNTSDDKAKPSYLPRRHRRRSVSDLDSGTKLRNKRKRNRTVEIDSWQGTVCQYTQRTFGTKKPEEPVEEIEASKQVRNVEQDLEQGLEIIIDRLRNIETKLDELKTLEATHGVTLEKKESREGLNQEESSLGLEDKSEVTTVDSPMLHYAIRCQEKEEVKLFSGTNESQDGEEDDVTLKDELSDDNISVLTDKTELFCVGEDSTCDADDDTDFETYQISSPVSSHARQCSIGKVNQLDIVSLSSVEDECAAVSTEGEFELEEAEEDQRKRRIEEMAQQFLEDASMCSPYDEEVDERPTYMHLSLDTVSERSEDDSDFNWRSSREISRKKNRPTRRTRSQSREGKLQRIKYCWRCHNTGHESFDCRIEPQPGSWCPRCLEVSHWEDQCWVNETEVFCNVCSLPGHLPCVHQTNDFRQRKLVIETFGWLSFKEWFREAEFWSWWNMSGFTNVPLYKLMQHRPGVVVPS